MLSLIIRVGLSAILFVAGVAKLLDRPGSRNAMANLGVPDALVGPTSWVLPASELAISVMLLRSGTFEYSSVAAMALFGVFTLGIAFNYLRGRTGRCHCFGSLHSAPMDSVTLIRNLVFTCLAAFLVWQREAISLSGPLLGEPPSLIAGTLVLAMTLVVGLLLVRLVQHQTPLPVIANGSQSEPLSNRTKGSHPKKPRPRR